MRFNVKHATSGRERVGSLTEFIKFQNAVIEIPTSALFTRYGSVVHLTAEVLSKVFTTQQLLWLPLSHSIQLEPGVKVQGEGVAKFVGLSDHITCTTLHNTMEINPPGHFEQDKVPLWTKNGKRMITAEKYMDVMETFKPDIILAAADGRTTLDEGSKRIQKSISRTCNMLDICVKQYKDSKILQYSSIIGVVAGAGQMTNCENSIQHLLKHKESLSGVALQGITDGTEESLNVPLEKLEGILKHVSGMLPNELLRIMEGPWNPAVVVMAIEYGWDLFDGSYPVKLTDAGLALALNFDVDGNSKEFCILDLKDERYKEEFKPILEGCECLACKKHTRAYIRHLLNTREMLAQVLLSIHNLHHFDEMFKHARRHIMANTFTIYKRHITTQYELYKASLTINDNCTESKNIEEDNKIAGESNENVRNKKMKVSDKHNCSVDSATVVT